MLMVGVVLIIACVNVAMLVVARNGARDPEPIRPSAFQAHFQPVLPGADLVAQQPRRTVVVGHDDVEGAVVVDITKSSAAAHGGNLKGGARQARDLLKPALTVVVKELAFLRVG